MNVSDVIEDLASTVPQIKKPDPESREPGSGMMKEDYL
jgi:hypothetical protein